MCTFWSVVSQTAEPKEADRFKRKREDDADKEQQQHGTLEQSTAANTAYNATLTASADVSWQKGPMKGTMGRKALGSLNVVVRQNKDLQVKNMAAKDSDETPTSTNVHRCVSYQDDLSNESMADAFELFEHHVVFEDMSLGMESIVEEGKEDYEEEAIDVAYLWG